MGLLLSNVELMLKAKNDGACFNNVLTIGHLKLFITKADIQKIIGKYKLNIDVNDIKDTLYCDDLFKVLFGTKNIQALDYSDYEDCDIIHDMNRDIDTKYYKQFDVVIDGGSLEHIFNFPVAISNCMQVLKKNGSLFIFTMANNHMGHGFYQFSPELFYRVLNESNGYKVVELLLEEHKYPGAELNQKTNIYRVKDPNILGERVGLVSKFPVIMLVYAIRQELKPILETNPIQSDYLTTYIRQENKPLSKSSKLKIMIKKLFLMLPQKIQFTLEGKHQLFKYSFRNKTFYKKVNK